ncbi:HNH endonuclease signature motif containing protein [Nocardioides sp. AX2bis]|uniref:HNH endonuclease signature motif containing protein n=1 Tax=Nocardioides sp. AX2bis TaxID=2653157 RepID=UPI0012EFA42B|nr:HNH endonuclease signature motif containing protein [Nocardioides sp. AX2bis]VXC01183.1 HNH endonuclease (Precursor) [Nocardioides sp. AX2bis]
MEIETDRAGSPAVLADLDDDWLLDLAEESEVASREAERRRLRLTAHWCRRRVVPADPHTGAPGGGDPAQRWRLDPDEAVGGDGCPALAPFSAEPLGTAFSLSTSAALQLMHDVQDLVHRLPLAWARVESLEVPAWRARRLAQATHGLNAAAAAAVDQAVSPRLHRIGVALIDRAVGEAAAEHDPAAQAAREELARRGWDVRVGPEVGPGGVYDGSSWLEAHGDTDDVNRFYELVGDVAADLATEATSAAAVPEDVGVRRARALGRITDLVRGTADPGDRTGPAGAPMTRTRRREARAYIHLTPDPDDPRPPAEQVATVERLGALTLERLGPWLEHSTVRVVGVLDLAATSTDRPDLVTDAHDPSPELRELVVLRDSHCVFPWCTVDSRDCDLDHVEPYVPPEDGGPPGQTCPEGLAPLCRRHHRAKTARAWSYRRERDGTYTWTDPRHGTHRVDPRAR